MRILFLLTYYYPHWTGLSQYAKRLAEGLAQEGFQVRVLTTLHESKLRKKEVIHGVDVVRKPVLFRLSRTLLSLSLVFSFWKEIYNSQTVVVYLPYSEVLLASIISKLLHKKIVLIHNGDLHLPKGLLNKFIEMIYYLSTYLALVVADEVVIQTRDYAKHSKLLIKFKKKWRVILPLFIKPHMKTRGGKRAYYTVGFAGRFVNEKGFDILFAAIPLVIKHIPSVRFVFAGETNIPYENFYIQQKDLVFKNRQYLEFKGKLNEQEMAKFYRQCDIFVIPSRSDCFPSVGVEAMLSGVPLVVTDIAGARQQVKMTGMGSIVKSSDPVSLANGIVQVLTKKKAYSKKREKVIQFFDYEKTLGSYKRILT